LSIFAPIHRDCTSLRLPEVILSIGIFFPILQLNQMYRQLLSNDEYETRICGMHFNLAEKVRALRKEGGEDLRNGVEAIKYVSNTTIFYSIHIYVDFQHFRFDSKSFFDRAFF
jgi:hypothetical protein